EAGGRVKLKDLGVVKGALGVNFTAIKNRNQSKVEWAFTGGTTVAGGEPIQIVNILEANATVMVNNDGFLLDCSVSGGFDVWIISIKGEIAATIWYLKSQRQFGAYAEIGVEASVLGGLASLGGTAKGALIIEKSDFLLYASLTGYVKVVAVFEGDMTVWMSVSRKGWKGGRGTSGYEDLIAQAREDAKNLNERADQLLASIEAAKNEILPLSNETLASAGQALYMADKASRTNWANRFIQNEARIRNPVHQAFQNIKNEVIDGDRPKDDLRQTMLNQMKNAITEVNSKSSAAISSLRQLQSSSVQWEAQSAQLLANLQNPIRNKNFNWNGDVAPSMEIDTIQAASNATQSEELKDNIDELNDDVFKAAIDTTIANIHKIERALDGRAYSLQSGGSTSTTTVAELAKAYQNAVYRIRRFYGTQISYYLALERWARLKIPSVHGSNNQGTGPMDLANDAVLRSFGITYSKNKYPYSNQYGNYTDEITVSGISIQASVSVNPKTNFSRLSNTNKGRFRQGINVPTSKLNAIAKRKELITEWTGESNSSATLSNTLSGYLSNDQYLDFINGVNQTTRDLTQMQTFGLGAIEANSRDTADSLVTASNTVLTELQLAHEEFSTLLNDVYRVKYSMLINLHAMFEGFNILTQGNTPQGLITNMTNSYSGLLSITSQPSSNAGSLSSTEGNNLSNRIAELDDLLISPQIGRIGVITKVGDNGFDNELMISWTATHPYLWRMGVVENSYTIRQGRSTSVYSRGFLTSGKDKYMYYHVYADNGQNSTKFLNIRIRARGPAGNTVTRFINRQAAFDPINPGRTTTEWNAVDDDTTPPATPFASPSYSRRESPSVSGRRYWSNDPRNIEFSLISSDNQSDIVKIECAVGTSKGGSDIVPWKQVYGRAALSGNNSFSTFAQKVKISNLNLELETDYYLSVRVSNGEGLQSPVKEVSTPIRIDISSPEVPSEEEVVASGSGALPLVTFWNTSYQHNYVTAPPLMETPPTGLTAAIPNLHVKWSASTDALSGLAKYEYVVSNHSNPTLAFAEGEVKTRTARSSRELQINGDPLNFEDSTYVHVKAVDYAGNRSRTLTISRLPKDPSIPSLPKTTVMTRPDGLNLYLTKPSYDLESKIKGYQYAIGTFPYGGDIKRWPVDNELDNLYMNPWIAVLGLGVWWNAVYNNGRWNSNSITAPHYEIGQLNEGVPYYIMYRTLNGQNMKSYASTSGPVRLDTSSPPEPSVTLSLDGDKLTIDASNIRDPQTGIQKVEYKVINRFLASANSSNWNTLTYLNRTQYNPLSVSKEIDWTESLFAVTVGIRLTNGNGMQSTFWFDGSQYGQIMFQSTNSFNFNWD
ncbi:MAG: hypothetical protein AAF693_21720, partial [Bacteroidota bacterium]